RGAPRSNGTSAAPRISVQAGESSTPLIVGRRPHEQAAQPLRRDDERHAGDEAEDAMEAEPLLEAEFAVLVHQGLDCKKKRTKGGDDKKHRSHERLTIRPPRARPRAAASGRRRGPPCRRP